MTTLTRCKAELKKPVVPKILPEDQQLADDAAKLLGYKLLRKKIRRETIKEDEQFINAMNNLRIEPYDAKSVAAYKAKAVKDNSRTTAWDCVRRIAIDLLVIFGVSLLVCCVIASILDPPVPHLLGICAGVSVLGVIICLPLLAIAMSHVTSIKAFWFQKRMDLYPAEMPEFAIQTAVDLKKRCPHARFYIDSLQVQKVVLDPFLYARDATGKRWYLEVWNEPKFQAQYR